MSLHRRTALQVAGTAGLASLAGCSALADLFSQDAREYALTVDSVAESPVEHALYDPADEALFERAASAALADILPDGRHETTGFEPLPADSYVEHDGRFFQTDAVVTGRERVERTLVRAERVDPDGVSGDVTPVESLPEASARVVKILHSNAAGGGSDAAAADLLENGAYVLRRPAELEGPIAGDLDGDVVSMDADGHWTYRLRIDTESVREPVYETFAVEVAADTDAFRDVVLATRIDADLSGTTLEPATRRRLDDAIEAGTYRETTPLDPPYRRLIEHLGLADVDVGKDGLLLWYEESLYRYGLYVSPVS